jgi:hypothetical protein
MILPVCDGAGRVPEPPACPLEGKGRLLFPLHPEFPTDVFEATSPLLCDLADTLGVVRLETVTQTISRAVQTATLAARCLRDRISERQLNRLAVALLAAEWLVLGDRVERRPPAPLPCRRPELDVVSQFVETSTWPPGHAPEVLEPVRHRLQRQALARLSLSDAVVLAVAALSDGSVEDCVRMLPEPVPIGTWFAEANRRFQKALMDVAEELLWQHGRQPPTRYVLAEPPSPGPALSPPEPSAAVADEVPERERDN